MLHLFLALIFFIKVFKQQSDEAFNSGKEIEAMKHLMFHRIASSLLVLSFGEKIVSSVEGLLGEKVVSLAE